MPFCTACGRQNPDDARFCSQCGTRLVSAESGGESRGGGAPETPGEATDARSGPPTRRSTRRTVS